VSVVLGHEGHSLLPGAFPLKTALSTPCTLDTAQQNEACAARVLTIGRWSDSTKALYEVLLFWAGPRITSLLQLNIGGPSLETIRKGLREPVRGFVACSTMRWQCDASCSTLLLNL
jgi:hypothetical protein